MIQEYLTGHPSDIIYKKESFVYPAKDGLQIAFFSY